MKNKYWHMIVRYFCPYCGKVKDVKRRKYTEKPKESYRRRVEVKGSCGGTFVIKEEIRCM